MPREQSPSKARARAFKPVAARFRGAPAGTTHGLSKPSSGLAPSSTSTADLEWERAMDARLAQWRFINLVAVAELQAEEAAACAGINAAAARLEAAVDDAAALTARLDAARARAAGPTFAARAREPLEALNASLESLAPAHARACADLVAALHALPARDIVADPGAAAALAREVARFRVAATEFADAARGRGAAPDAARALEDLAAVVADEAPGVRAALASTVDEAAEALGEETRARGRDTGRRRAARRRGHGHGHSSAQGFSAPFSSAFGSAVAAAGGSGTRPRRSSLLAVVPLPAAVAGGARG